MSRPPDAEGSESLAVVSVIIPTYRRRDSLMNLLKDLARQRAVAGEVIVVDQNSPPIEANWYPAEQQSLGPLKFRILLRPKGVVAARNAAAAEARGSVLVFLDDDVQVDDERFLAKHAENYRNDGIAAVCGQELVPPDFAVTGPGDFAAGTAFEQVMFFPRNSTERREACVLSTCNCSVRSGVLRAGGGFDPAYRGNSYGDDADLALRLNAKGHRIVFDPAVSVRHLKASTGGLRLGDPANPSSEEERYVSAWLFFFRHVPGRCRAWFLWHGILRKSLFLRYNSVRPYRWPRIVAGLLRAMREGWQMTRQDGAAGREPGCRVSRCPANQVGRAD